MRQQAERAEVAAGLRVIQLRRAERSSPTGEGTHEYSCQWLVSGHWRQQFYPSTKEHRPVWIDPYVKGPDDKPFKVPRETVFRVVR